MNEVRTERIGAILRCFADPDRLRVLTAVLDEAHTPAEIAALVSLGLAGTMRHLKKLERAGLVEAGPEARYRATLAELKQAVINLATPSRVPETASIADVDFDTREVLSAFFDGPRLKALPVRNRKKEIVLEELLRRIPWQPEYREAHLNELIKPIFEDYCAVRRAWIDFMYMGRDRGIYRWTQRGLDALSV
jgi:DNA-binding transcriptional ArsR family regulator